MALSPDLLTWLENNIYFEAMRLCAAFLHNPDLVFLDEPTIGLDVVARQHIREFIPFINRLSSQYQIRDLEVRGQPIEDTIRRIYEEQLLYNHPYYGKKNSAS